MDQETLDVIRKVGKTIWAILPWIGCVLWFHTWAYNKFPKYYFIILKILSRSKDTIWDFKARFIVDVEDIQEVYLNIEKVLQKKYPGKYKKTVNLPNKKLIECGYFSILIHGDFDFEDKSKYEIWFKIDRLNVTIKNSRERFRELRELFHLLEKENSPVKNDYVIDVDFANEKNPFFGLMLQRIGVENIKEFSCVIPISVLTSDEVANENVKNQVRIYKEKITINALSIDDLDNALMKTLLMG